MNLPSRCQVFFGIDFRSQSQLGYDIQRIELSCRLREKTDLTPIVGKVRNGKIEIVAPSEFSEGAEVRVWLDAPTSNDDVRLTPEEIERTLEAMSQVQPLVFTDQERIDWQKWLDEQEAFENASAESRARKLMSHWE